MCAPPIKILAHHAMACSACEDGVKLTVTIIAKNLAALDPSANNMMQCTRGVYSRFSGHAF
jgi:hypothetical protein